MTAVHHPPREAGRELAVLVRSGQALVAINSPDTASIAQAVSAAATTLGVAVFGWSSTKGLRRTDGGAGGAAVYSSASAEAALSHIESSSLAAIYVFESLAAHLTEPVVAQRLRDALAAVSAASGALVVLDDPNALPPDLRERAVLIALPVPGPADYEALIRKVYYALSGRMRVKTQLDPAAMTRLLRSLAGLSLAEAERLLTTAIVEDGVLDARDIDTVLVAKHSRIAASGFVEFVPVDISLDDLGDFGALKHWLAQRRAVVAEPERAARAGLPFPKGMLLVGVPGCGKSMCAKAVASDWGLPLIKLDTSAIYDKFIGESEKRFLGALAAAEAAGPVVLWIDEIEKAFSSGGDSDGGVSSRILGTFLSWLQDRAGDVFVVATANDIERLPPELVRKGRFDEIFFVDLPTSIARSQIFDVHLLSRNLEGFDSAELAAVTEGFSGAEIEQVVVSALYSSFASGTTPTMETLHAEAARTRPLALTMSERVAKVREWAAGRTVSAR